MANNRSTRPPEPIQFTWYELEEMYVLLIAHGNKNAANKIGAVLELRYNGTPPWAKLKKGLGL